MTIQKLVIPNWFLVTVGLMTAVAAAGWRAGIQATRIEQALIRVELRLCRLERSGGLLDVSCQPQDTLRARSTGALLKDSTDHVDMETEAMAQLATDRDNERILGGREALW